MHLRGQREVQAGVRASCGPQTCGGEAMSTETAVTNLTHNTRRMLQALDAYWLHCDGLPNNRYPRSSSTAEDWWGRFEKYRDLVEQELR